MSSDSKGAEGGGEKEVEYYYRPGIKLTIVRSFSLIIE